MRIGNHFAWLMSTLLITVCAAATPAQEADEADEAEKLIVRVYNVSDLVQTVPDFPYSPVLPTTLDEKRSFLGVSGNVGGFGGGGMRGGGYGGGGGFFSVRDQAALTTAAPVMQIAGGEGSGENAAPSVFQGNLQPDTQFDVKDLADLITTTIHAETWDEMGGNGDIRPLGTLLVVRNTQPVHTQIEELLAAVRRESATSQLLNVDAIWLELDAQQLKELASQKTTVPVVVDAAKFDALVASHTRYRGQLSCFNGQRVHLVSGERRTVSTGAIPTVGQGATAFHIYIANPNIGVLLQLTAFVSPPSSSSRSAIVNLASAVTEWSKPDEPIILRSLSFSGGEAPNRGFGDGAIGDGNSSILASIDRVRIKANELGTSVRVPLGEPVLVGGLSTPTDADQNADTPRKQLYLILKVSASE